MSARSDVLREALRAGGSKSPAAKVERRKKLAKRRPWQALAEEWHEEMKRVFGGDYMSSPWKLHEPQLARKLLKEVDLDEAIKMVQHFIRTWDKSGTPGFGYFWAARDSVRAEVRGKVKSRREMIDTDEFSEERTAHLPKLGW